MSEEINDLKQVFATGKRPTGEDFSKLIDGLKPEVTAKDIEGISSQLADKANKSEVQGLVTNKVDRSELSPLASKDYVTEQIVQTVTEGTVDISTKASVTYVDEMNGLNNYTTVLIKENNVVVAIEERLGATVVSRTNIIRNSTGEVVSTSKTMNGKTVTSTYNKLNGQLVSISKTLGGAQ